MATKAEERQLRTRRRTQMIRTPLQELIQSRLMELNLDYQALGFRLGYKNPAKAAGRILALCDGQIFSLKSRSALARLHQALELPRTEVDSAHRKTEKLLLEQKGREAERERLHWEEAENEWRRRFRPHAVLFADTTRPSQITFFGITGGAERWLIIRFDHSRPSPSFVQQTLDRLPEKTRLNSSGEPIIMFFGPARGFVINYTPDHAVRYDLAGNEIEVLSKAYRPGDVTLFLGGKSVTASVAAAVIGQKGGTI